MLANVMAEFVTTAQHDNLSDDADAALKVCELDTLGCALGAHQVHCRPARRGTRAR